MKKLGIRADQKVDSQTRSRLRPSFQHMTLRPAPSSMQGGDGVQLLKLSDQTGSCMKSPTTEGRLALVDTRHLELAKTNGLSKGCAG
jgi:hypothetical protein